MTMLKTPAIRSPKIMEWARDHPAGCQIRLPEYCVWGPTMWCHIPAGVRFGKGTARKGPDILIALGCFQCHQIVDGHIKTDLEPDFIRRCWHEAHCATEVLMVQDGLIEVVR